MTDDDFVAASKALDAWMKSQGINDNDACCLALAHIALMTYLNCRGEQYEAQASRTIEILNEGFEFYRTRQKQGGVQ